MAKARMFKVLKEIAEQAQQGSKTENSAPCIDLMFVQTSNCRVGEV